MYIKMPAFAFNNNSSYAWYTDVPNTSLFYPSYSYGGSANGYINKETNPAFVSHDATGCWMQGGMLYGALTGSHVNNSINHKDFTQVWSQAIPISSSENIALCSINAYSYIRISAVATTGPNFLGTHLWYIGTDHLLKYGIQNSGPYSIPTEVINTGINMEPYMYENTVLNTDAYIGHRYAFTYNTEQDLFNLYVDNTATVLYSMNSAQFTSALINIWPSFASYYNTMGYNFVNISRVAAGAVMYNNTGQNVYNMNGIYFDAWTVWANSLDVNTINNIMMFNAEMLYVPTNSTYSAFGLCRRIEELAIPGGFKVVPSGLAGYCPNLKTITFSEGVETICYNTVSGGTGLNVVIPRSVTNISSEAFRTPVVNKPTISWNVPMRYNMFNGITEYSNIHHYEQPVELRYSLPLKQPRPADLNMGIVNLRTTGLANINTEQDPIVIERLDTEHSGVVFNFYETPISPSLYHGVIHNINAASLNEAGFDMTAYSMQFPYLNNTVHCSFINTDFIYTNSAITANIIGHATGSYSLIPNTIDNTYIVSNIELGTNLPTQDVTIKGINRLEVNDTILSLSSRYGIPYIYRSFNNCSTDISIQDAYYVTAASSFNNMTGNLIFKNCNYIYAMGLSASSNLIFENCPNIAAGPLSANTFCKHINNLYMLPGVNSLELANIIPTDITFRYLRQGINTVYSAIAKVDLGDSLQRCGSTLFNNCAFNSIQICNHYGTRFSSYLYHGLFVNSRGTFSVDTYNIYCTEVPDAKTNFYMFHNTTGIISDFNFVSNIIATYNTFNNSMLPRNVWIGAAQNTTIENVYINLEGEMDAIETIAFNRCNINNIKISSANIPCNFLQYCNANLLTIESVAHIGSHAFQGTKLNCSIQPILDCNPYIHTGAFYYLNGSLDTNITINLHGEQNMQSAFSSMRQRYTSITFNCLDNYYSSRKQLGTALNTATLTYNGSVVPPDCFTGSSVEVVQIDNSCERILYNAFYNCRSITSLNIAIDCFAIAANAFTNCVSLTDIYVSNSTHIAKDAIPSTANIHYYENRPVDIRITAPTNRAYQTLFKSSKALYSVTAYYADGTSKPVTNFSVFPDIISPIPVIMPQYDRAIIHAEGLVNTIIMPYNQIINVTTGTTTGTGTTLRYTTANTYNYAYINSTVMGSTLHNVTAPVNIDTAIIAGSINYIMNTCELKNTVHNLIFANTSATSLSTRATMFNGWNKLQTLRYLQGFAAINGNIGIAHYCESLSIVQMAQYYGQVILPSNSFISCNSLQELYLPKAINPRIISNNAVKNCNSLVHVDFSGLTNTNIVIYNDAFNNCYGLTNIVLPSGVKNICNGAFNRTSIKAVNIPRGCVVGASAFPSDCVITYI